MIATLRELLPASVVVCETARGGDASDLFPEEAALVAGAIERRVSEFAAARRCAHRALDELGAPAGPILPLGDDAPPWARRAPRWPPGVVGSLTHCAGYHAAAVAHASEVAALGVDAEPAAALPDGVLDVVATGPEIDAVARLGEERPAVAWDRLLFSAKESVFKAWFGSTGRWLEPRHCAVTLDPAAGTFTARVVDEARAFAGAWRAAGGLVLTAVATARSPGRPDG